MTVNKVYEKAGINSLPISTEEAAKRLGIKLVSYKTLTEIYEISLKELYAKSLFGFSFIEDGRYIIAVNENSCCERRRRFTVAHEIGHCVLGHLSGTENKIENERDADRFAGEFLAPTSVLRACGINSAEEIARVCAVSKTSAKICLKRISNGVRTAEEDEVLKRFNGFIRRYLDIKRQK